MSKIFDFGKMDKDLSKIPGFELGSMLSDNDFSEVDDWISTGSLIMNAQVSGSLFGGVPNTRSFGLMGDPGTGKSFLCLNIVREAQKKGYNVIYCDTEGAIDKTSALKFGIDANKIRYQPIQTVSQFQTFVSNVVDMVKKAKTAGESPKILLIVDSLGMLSTDKELADAVKGHNAADMGSKAKELRKLFRVITLDLTAAKIPMVVTNHVYCLTAGHKVIMADGSLKNIEDIRVDDIVQTLAGPKPVSETHSFGGQDTIKLTLENGQTIECTPNHKFLVENEWTQEKSWKASSELEEGDFIIFSDEI
jgi:archaellum biogenesis ATPase FlaH